MDFEKWYEPGARFLQLREDLNKSGACRINSFPLRSDQPKSKKIILNPINPIGGRLKAKLRIVAKSRDQSWNLLWD